MATNCCTGGSTELVYLPSNSSPLVMKAFAARLSTAFIVEAAAFWQAGNAECAKRNEILANVASNLAYMYEHIDPTSDLIEGFKGIYDRLSMKAV